MFVFLPEFRNLRRCISFFSGATGRAQFGSGDADAEYLRSKGSISAFNKTFIAYHIILDYICSRYGLDLDRMWACMAYIFLYIPWVSIQGCVAGQGSLKLLEILEAKGITETELNEKAPCFS